MLELTQFLISGITLGLIAGISPGPLLALVISETLKHNKIAGIKVAIAPLITDGPILVVSLFLLTQIRNLNIILGLISLLGAIFLTYLAIESLTIKRVKVDVKKIKLQSLSKGIITNALNPHPYLFYITVGGPIMIKALNISTMGLILFILSFLLLLVGSKVIIATIVERSRTFLKSRYYIYTIKFLGLILLIFAGIFLRDALKFLEFIK